MTGQMTKAERWALMRTRITAGPLRAFAAMLPVVGTIVVQIHLARRHYARTMLSPGSIDTTVLPPEMMLWDGRPLEVVALGDSGMAGVGVERMFDTLPVLIAKRVAAEVGRPVHVVSHARSGARTRDVLRDQLPLVQKRPDVVVMLIGTNDVTHLSRRGTLMADTQGLLTRLNALGVPVVMGDLPELKAMRAIPPLVRAALGPKTRSIRDVQARAAREAPDVKLVNVRGMVGPQFVADVANVSADHFHPSAAGYARIADVLAPAVAGCLDPEPRGLPATRHWPAPEDGVGQAA